MRCCVHASGSHSNVDTEVLCSRFREARQRRHLRCCVHAAGKHGKADTEVFTLLESAASRHRGVVFTLQGCTTKQIRMFSVHTAWKHRKVDTGAVVFTLPRGVFTLLGGVVLCCMEVLCSRCMEVLCSR